MAISHLSNTVSSIIGKDKITEIEKAKNAFGFENKIKNIEKELDRNGKEYISSAIQELRGIFGTYVENWKYEKIEKEIGYNVK